MVFWCININIKIALADSSINQREEAQPNTWTSTSSPSPALTPAGWSCSSILPSDSWTKRHGLWLGLIVEALKSNYCLITNQQTTRRRLSLTHLNTSLQFYKSALISIRHADRQNLFIYLLVWLQTTCFYFEALWCTFPRTALDREDAWRRWPEGAAWSKRWNAAAASTLTSAVVVHTSNALFCTQRRMFTTSNGTQPPLTANHPAALTQQSPCWVLGFRSDSELSAGLCAAAA